MQTVPFSPDPLSRHYRRWFLIYQAHTSKGLQGSHPSRKTVKSFPHAFRLIIRKAVFPQTFVFLTQITKRILLSREIKKRTVQLPAAYRIPLALAPDYELYFLCSAKNKPNRVTNLQPFGVTQIVNLLSSDQTNPSTQRTLMEVIGR